MIDNVLAMKRDLEKEDRRNPALLCAQRSVLLIIDMQETFLPVTQGMDRAAKRIRVLAKGAARLDVPVVISEQYPQALGATLPELLVDLPSRTSVFSKLSFSACDVREWIEALENTKRDQFVLCGVETHVCILQTALDLLHNFAAQVYVVEDAVAAREIVNTDVGLRRMEAHGIQRVTTEMVLYEWLRKGGTAEFKELQALVK